MRYLILPGTAPAVTRSSAAWAEMAPVGTSTTTMLWSVVDLSDGRAALCIPETPDGAGIGLSQAAYDALLTADERAALVDALPVPEVP